MYSSYSFTADRQEHSHAHSSTDNIGNKVVNCRINDQPGYHTCSWPRSMMHAET